MSATATVVSIENFEDIIKENSAEDVGNPKTILNDISTLRTATPPMSKSELSTFIDRRSEALDTLVADLFTARFSAQYPLLDPEVFNMKRYFVLGKEDKVLMDATTKPSDKELGTIDIIKYNKSEFDYDLDQWKTVKKERKVKGKLIEASLFMLADLNDRTIEVFRRTTTRTNSWGGQYRKTVAVSANVPAVPSSVLEEGRKALGMYYTIMADCFNDPKTSDLLDTSNKAPSLHVMWIPTAQSLKIKVDTVNIPEPRRLDPALILKHGDQHYVIDLWDVEDEKPFEGILREFSKGTAKFPKKK